MIKHLKRYSLVYLATPYSKYKKGIEWAFIDAATLAGRMFLQGVPVYCPIAATHPMAIYGGIDPYDGKLWLPLDEKVMAICEALVVADLQGWEESSGVAHERRYFAERGRPAYLLDVNRLSVTILEDPAPMDNLKGNIHGAASSM